MASANAIAAGNSKATWVRGKNVERHPGYNVTDHAIPSEDDMSVENVLKPVLQGLTTQSNRMYGKKGSCELSLAGSTLTVKLTGPASKTPVTLSIPVVDVAMMLKVDAAYVLAQYVTSRLCHGIGDYFLEPGSHADNWAGIANDITRCIQLICAIEKKPKEPANRVAPVRKALPTEDIAFGQSVLAALERSRVNTDPEDIKKWTAYIKRWLEQGLELPVRTRIDIREIACDKVAVYAKIRPIQPSHKLAVKATGPIRLTPNLPDNTITWLKHDNSKVTFGPYKNIVEDTNNAGLMGISNATTAPNLSGQLARERAGGLTYDAVSTLASGVNVVLFGFGNSGTGKSFSLFGETKNNTLGALQLILNEMKEVKLKNIFEEAPGGRIAPGKLPNYDGRIIELYRREVLNLQTNNNSTATRQDDRKNIIIDRRQTALLKGSNPDTVDGIIACVNKLIEHRKTQLRIRATLNNGQSSRSHMYIIIDVWCGASSVKNNDAPTARLCVIDLGGMERPDTMLEDARSAVKRLLPVSTPPNQKDLRNTLLENRFKNGHTDDGKFGIGMVRTITDIVTNIYAPSGAKDSVKTELDSIYKGGRLLLSDWVAGYRDISDAKKMPTNTDVMKMKKYLRNNKQFAAVALCETIDPYKQANSTNPYDVMYPMGGTNRPVFKPVYVPENELVQGNYYSLIHLAALYVEGHYIVESLKQVKEFLRNDAPSRNQTVLTRRIMASITQSKTRYIMLFTMCPVKLQADQTSAVTPELFDLDFIEPATFVQDVCSTAASADP